jgi:ribosomal-protein-alanine N-acetyltransferase
VIATRARRAAVVLRPMRRSDLDAVLAIEQRSFPQPWSRAFFEKGLAAQQARCVVAVRAEDAAPARAGQIVGYTVVWQVLDERHLLNVAVHPESRGAGIGRHLVEDVLREGAASGGRVVYLEVRAGNVAGRRLYRRLGFHDLGIRRGYYGVGQDAIVMECRLADDR